MIDLECDLITSEVIYDDIGNETIEKIYTKCPIIKIEDVFSDEFYNASQLGLKPSLKLRISALKYDNQKQLKYMNNEYEIIRVDTPSYDEVSLVCERKVGNGN